MKEHNKTGQVPVKPVKADTFGRLLQGARVLVLRANWLPVSERFIYDELCCLKRYEPTVLCLCHEYAYARKFEVVADPGLMLLREKAYPFMSEKYAALYGTMIARALAVIGEKHIELLHAQCLSDAVFFLELQRRSGLPLVVSVRGHDLYAMKDGAAERIFAAADMFLVRSERMREDLLARGCPAEKVTVQHSGIMPVPAVRARATDEVRLLMAGRLVEKKGTLSGIRIFDALGKAFPQLKLFIAGDGPLRPQVLAAIKRSAFAERITFCGEIPNSKMLALMERCDILLHPSITASDGDREGIPGVVMEAMAHGLIVVTSDNGSIPEIVTHQKTGFLFPEGDLRAAVMQMTEAISRRGELSSLKKAAADRVRNDFNVKTETRKLEAIYDDVLQRRQYRAYDRYYQNYQHVLAHGRPLSFRADIHPVSGCNSFCIMCDNWKNKKAEILTGKEILGALKALQEMGCHEVRFHGQEPILRRDLPLLIAQAKRLGLRVGLKTNCLGLTRSACRRLAGIDTLYVSIDSPVEAIHNKLRGNAGSFQANLRVMGWMKALKPSLRIEANAVVMRSNYQSLGDMPRFAAGHGIARISFVLPNSKNKKSIRPLLMTRAGMEAFFFQIVPGMIAECQAQGIRYDFSPFFADLVLERPQKVIRELTSRPEQFREEIDNYLKMDYGKTFHERYGCHGPLDHASINYDGSVFPCCVVERSAAFSVGNISEDNFSHIWESERYTNVRDNTVRTRGRCCAAGAGCASNFNARKALAVRLRADEQAGERAALDYLDKMTRLFIMDRAVIDGAVSVRLRGVLQEALLECSFYKDRIITGRGKDPSLEVRGFLTKENMRNNIHAGLISRKYRDHRSLVLDRTSGSMDEAVPFAYLRGFHRYVRMVLPFLANTPWTWGGRYLVLTTLHCSREKCTSDDLPSYVNRVKVPTSDRIFTDRKVLARATGVLKENRGALLHADPVYLCAVARYAQVEKMKLFFSGISSTYEMLTPAVQRYLEKVFRCRVFDNYGCSETGPVAFSCEKGRKHIFENAVLVEIVDKGRYADPEVGEIVVTTLEDPAMPLIRYRTGDLGKKSEVPCGCGRHTRVMEIHGRERCSLRLEDGMYTERDMAALLDIPGILLYQVVDGADDISVRVLPDNGYATVAAQRRISAAVTRRFARLTKLPVTVSFTDHLLPEASGKFQTVITQRASERSYGK